MDSEVRQASLGTGSQQNQRCLSRQKIHDVPSANQQGADQDHQHNAKYDYSIGRLVLSSKSAEIDRAANAGHSRCED